MLITYLVLNNRASTASKIEYVDCALFLPVASRGRGDRRACAAPLFEMVRELATGRQRKYSLSYFVSDAIIFVLIKLF